MKRVGIFSGTFDPVHEGHIEFAKEAAANYGLDRVFLLVEPRPRRKQGVRALEHRVEMVKRAIAHEPKLGLIILEQARFNVVETLPVLEARFPHTQLYMLMGEDGLSHLAHWPQIEQLVPKVHFIIGMRKHNQGEVKRRIKVAEQVRGIKVQYEVFRPLHNDYASTAIRLQLKRGHEPTGLHPRVYKYIQAEGLYAPSDLE